MTLGTKPLRLAAAYLLVAMLAACAGTAISADGPKFADHVAEETLVLARAGDDEERADALLDMMEYRLDEMVRLAAQGKTAHVNSLAISYRDLCVKGLAPVVRGHSGLRRKAAEHVSAQAERIGLLPTDLHSLFRGCKNVIDSAT